MIRLDYYIGTAAWAIPSEFSPAFPKAGSHLERYAARLSGVEINSSFYREHQAKTYERWSRSVPDEFRFAVKISREITHRDRLEPRPKFLEESIARIRSLGDRQGPLLIQLPPSLGYVPGIANRFFRNIRKLHSGPIAIEPRHPDWTTEEARSAFLEYRLSKVIADPERCPIDDLSVQGAGGVFYLRLHGSPEIYRSPYSEATINEVASALRAAEKKLPVWCIFDNTTFGFATRDALRLQERLDSPIDLSLRRPV